MVSKEHKAIGANYPPHCKMRKYTIYAEPAKALPWKLVFGKLYHSSCRRIVKTLDKPTKKRFIENVFRESYWHTLEFIAHLTQIYTFTLMRGASKECLLHLPHPLQVKLSGDKENFSENVIFVLGNLCDTWSLHSKKSSNMGRKNGCFCVELQVWTVGLYWGSIWFHSRDLSSEKKRCQERRCYPTPWVFREIRKWPLGEKHCLSPRNYS